ncbi:MAG: hypothetical protein V3V49_00110 [Candidatus Krumholzibacteria bacterium]
MTYQHKELASGRWIELSLAEQMANIGSEVSRAMRWRRKGNAEYAQRAAVRALELLDLSLDAGHSHPRLRELARVREAVVDYLFGSNEFASSDALWQSYFDHFSYAARVDRTR